ncbi:MAG TPA: hypothetical protein VKQ89_05620, partial [Candidatus Angelobacter sp.]|nr:hypothetical protein [Candidatus Angelobacter sp.]
MELTAKNTNKQDEAILIFPDGNFILTSLIEFAELCQIGAKGKTRNGCAWAWRNASGAHSLNRLQ